MQYLKLIKDMITLLPKEDRVPVLANQMEPDGSMKYDMQHVVSKIRMSILASKTAAQLKSCKNFLTLFYNRYRSAAGFTRHYNLLSSLLQQKELENLATRRYFIIIR